MKRALFSVVLLCVALTTQAQNDQNPFRQLGQDLPTPNVYRNAAGAPGHMYWQQRADYEMDIRLDDENQRIYGTETITYYNQSPDPLEYLWVQLDQNVRALDSDTYSTSTTQMGEQMSLGQLSRLEPTFDGGFKIDYVKSGNGKDLTYSIQKTMMRIELEEPLQPDESMEFDIKYW